MPRTRHRLKPAILSGLLLLGIFSSVSLALFQSNAAYADIDTSLNPQARAWVLMSFFARWNNYNYDNSNSLSNDSVKNIDYVPESGTANDCWSHDVGWLLETSRGQMARDDAFTCSGFGSGSNDYGGTADSVFGTMNLNRQSFVQALGFNQQPDSTWTGGDFSTGHLTTALTKSPNFWPPSIKGGDAQVTNSAIPNWIQYLDLVQDLQKGGCLPSGIALTQFPAGDGNIELVNSDGSKARYKVSATGNSTPVAIGNLSCSDVVGRLKPGNGLTSSYAQILAGIAAAAANSCSQKYASQPDQAAACAVGYNDGRKAKTQDPSLNATTWCTQKYPSNQLLIDACVFGMTDATSATAPTPVNAGNPNSPDQSKPTCTIPGGLGWIVCPVVNLLASITDASYGTVTKLLKFDDNVSSIKDTSGGLYQAWNGIRNVANVAFIIAFLMVIYSQITGAGLGNYGIKKMLPRIIVAVILVNISYWLCLIAVDISNIVGSSMDSFLSGLGPNNYNTGNPSGTNIWGNLAAGILGTVAIVFIGLSALLPALIIVLITIIVIMLVLIVRQALIILLIAISPLAFVAYLLPNTEQWFKKWRELFQTMLLLYPIVGVIFGASALASSVLGAAAVTRNPDGTTNTDTVMSIMAALVGIVPLVLVPATLKGSHAMFGKISGAVNNRSRGLQGAAKKYRENRQDYRKLKALNGSRTLPGMGVAVRARQRREAVLANRKSEFNRANAEYISGVVAKPGGSRLGAAMARGGGDAAETRALASAIATQHELSAKEIKAEGAVIDHLNLSADQRAELAKGGSVTTSAGRQVSGNTAAIRMAARESVFELGDAEAINKVMDHASGMNAANDSVELNHLADTAGRSQNKPSYIQAGDLLNLRQQGLPGSQPPKGSAEMIDSAVKSGVYSADRMASSGKQEMEIVVNRIKDNVAAGRPTDGKAEFAASASKALSDPRLEPRIGKQRQALTDASHL